MKLSCSSMIRLLLTAVMLCLVPLQLWAACSAHMGLAVLNEVSKEQQNSDSANDFVEVKLLDNSIPASEYSTWSVQICENSGAGCNTVSMSTADASGLPWLVLSDLANVGSYLDLTVGTEVLLMDGNGDPIDYLSVGGFSPNRPADCAFVYDTDVNSGNRTRRVQRSPDGTGDWAEPPGNSAPPTDSTTNDDNVPADAPSMTISDASAAAGGDLTFTVSLSAAYSSDVTVNYQTYDNTAVAGVDYTAISGTATIPQGSTTVTLTVSSFPAGGGSFFLSLSNATNALITDQAGKGVIFPDPLAEWRMDEYGWTGAAGEVSDSSGNNFNGTASNDAGTADTTPATEGSPGTCYYGEFDGDGDYVTVADSAALDLSSELTITAWVRPQSGGAILSKGGTDTVSYSLRLTTGNALQFRWCEARAGTICDAVQSLTSSASLPLDQWSHVAISFTSGYQRLYINGAQDGVSTSTNAIVANADNLYLGAAVSSLVSDQFAGALDEVRLYDHALDALTIGAIMNTTRTCVPAVFDHYHISFDGGATASDSSAITCEAATVTITAHAIGHMGTVIPAAGTSINLSTSTNLGYWSSPSAGTVTDNGNGAAVYTFDGTQQSISLQFNHTTPAVSPNPVNINIDGGSGEDPAEDPVLQFFETGFRFVDAADVATMPDQIAGQESATHYLQAIRTDLQSGACVGIFADGQQVNVELAAECNNPSSCAGQQVSLTNNATSSVLATSADNGGAGTAAYNNVSVLFGPDSKAAFSVNYPDVGSISLHARHQLRNEDGTLSNDFMVGSSNSFVVAPASFAITAISAGGSPNPGTTSTGSGFVAAGEAFRVVVQARNALGNLTPNYGNETAPEGIRINFDTLVFPAGGSSGTLSAATAFAGTGTPGEFENSSISWSEVGSFSAYASVADGDYLGAGDAVSPSTGTVGRFYPAEFRLASSSVVNSCALGPFSYMSEPGINVSYQVEAHRSGGGVVLNYDSADLGYPTAGSSFHAESNNDGIDLGSRLSVAGATWNDGVLSVSDPTARFSRDASPDGPHPNLAVGIRLVDLDGVNFDVLDFKAGGSNDCMVDGDCDSRALAGMLEARFGRMYLQDGHGPESSPIPMVWQSEYWNGERFVLNADDQCTELPLAAVVFVGASTLIDDANDTVHVDLGGIVSIVDFSDPLGSNDCLSASDIRMCDGRAGLAYGAPGAIITYPISVDLSGLPWLQGDWNQDGSYSDSSLPLVNIRFQHYRGHDRVIYWQEILD